MKRKLPVWIIPWVDPDDLVPISLSVTASAEEQEALVDSLISKPSAPCISVEANEFRAGPAANSVHSFRKDLLRELRKEWVNTTEAEARFIRLAELLQRDGCAVFAGLVNGTAFQRLIDDFSDIMAHEGSHAFLHSFSHLVEHPRFFQSPTYGDAMIHPLVIALMAYAMGGPVRMTDARGKDTQPISVNAQDNMLHVDNTPFRDEYKILVGWEKDKVKGPASQNFTFLPGTHKGTRAVRVDMATQQPWSTENDSLFITNLTIDSVFAFQQNVTGRPPTVVEVEYPDQPVTIVFNAGSLVHHRYRNKDGNTRSCVISAFHLASDHPGALIDPAIYGIQEPTSVADLLLGYQDGSQVGQFCRIIGSRARKIESKMAELLDENHEASLVDTAQLTLSGEKLQRWREIIVNAPFSTQLKLEAGHYLSFAGGSISRRLLVEKLAGAMAYDKHGLLDLIIYHDGHEEIRKPARKSIWTMPKQRIAEIIDSRWLTAVEGYRFTMADVRPPAVLQQSAYEVARLLREAFSDTVNFAVESIDRHQQQLSSAHQLIVDLGESLTRCEKVETYITTNLFLFFITDQILPFMDRELAQRVDSNASAFLRAYIACVLVVEQTYANGVAVEPGEVCLRRL
ncbi:hypothetical protein B0T14DRAFT_538189 [Immersiella caudata]|uniref:Uncharacterized protein n=1 Tax=Immersiella caudata TaxID=314043 RepID=A0AA39WT56_9PEZI|nr:hypothetical protein B0T14DRAFT_538189 [Immersiella caudata]